MTEKGMRDNTLEIIAKNWLEARMAWLDCGTDEAASPAFERYQTAELQLAAEVAKLK